MGPMPAFEHTAFKETDDQVEQAWQGQVRARSRGGVSSGTYHIAFDVPVDRGGAERKGVRIPDGTRPVPIALARPDAPRVVPAYRVDAPVFGQETWWTGDPSRVRVQLTTRNLSGGGANVRFEHALLPRRTDARILERLMGYRPLPSPQVIPSNVEEYYREDFDLTNLRLRQGAKYLYVRAVNSVGPSPTVGPIPIRYDPPPPAPTVTFEYGERFKARVGDLHDPETRLTQVEITAQRVRNGRVLDTRTVTPFTFRGAHAGKGTYAHDMDLYGLGLKRGDEVVVTVTAVNYTGGTTTHTERTTYAPPATFSEFSTPTLYVEKRSGWQGGVYIKPHEAKIMSTIRNMEVSDGIVLVRYRVRHEGIDMSGHWHNVASPRTPLKGPQTFTFEVPRTDDWQNWGGNLTPQYTLEVAVTARSGKEMIFSTQFTD